MVDTIDDTRDTIEPADEMHTATDEPSDDVSEVAEKRIILSYETIDRMNKTFDATNVTTEEMTDKNARWNERNSQRNGQNDPNDRYK